MQKNENIDLNRELLNAINEHKVNFVEKLLEAGADPNWNDGKSCCLEKAIYSGSIDMVGSLLDYGADPMKKYPADSQIYDECINALEYYSTAFRKPDLEIFKVLVFNLIDAGRIDEIDLMDFVECANSEVILFLLEIDVKKNAKKALERRLDVFYDMPELFDKFDFRDFFRSIIELRNVVSKEGFILTHERKYEILRVAIMYQDFEHAHSLLATRQVTLKCSSHYKIEKEDLRRCVITHPALLLLALAKNKDSMAEKFSPSRGPLFYIY